MGSVKVATGNQCLWPLALQVLLPKGQGTPPGPAARSSWHREVLLQKA